MFCNFANTITSCFKLWIFVQFFQQKSINNTSSLVVLGVICANIYCFKFIIRKSAVHEVSNKY